MPFQYFWRGLYVTNTLFEHFCQLWKLYPYVLLLLASPPPCSPDALVQSSQFGHQLSGPFVFIAAQVVYSLNGLGGRLQLVFIDVDSLVLRVKMANIGRNETNPPQAVDPDRLTRTKNIVCLLFLGLVPFSTFQPHWQRKPRCECTCTCGPG